MNGAPPFGTVIGTDGYLTGTPSVNGTFTFGVCVTDSVGSENCTQTGVVVAPNVTTTTVNTTTTILQTTTTLLECSSYNSGEYGQLVEVDYGGYKYCCPSGYGIGPTSDGEVLCCSSNYNQVNCDYYASDFAYPVNLSYVYANPNGG
jgi:hypothetical protein